MTEPFRRVDDSTVLTAEAVQFVGCSKYDLYRAREAGDIVAEKVGGVIRWPRANLGDLRAKRERDGRRGGTVAERWDRGERVGIHSTIEKLAGDGKCMAKEAESILGISWYRLRKIPASTLPFESYGKQRLRVYRRAEVERLAPTVHAQNVWDRPNTLSVAETVERLGMETEHGVHSLVRRERLLVDDPDAKPRRITIASIEAYEATRHPTQPRAKAAIHKLELRTRNDTAQQWGISLSRVRDLIFAGVIPGVVTRKAAQRTAYLIPQSVIDAEIDAKHPCKCGCGEFVYRWNEYAVGHRVRDNQSVDWLTQATCRLIQGRIDSSTDSADRRRWRQLKAGVLERRSRWQQGMHREPDLRLDLTVARAEAGGVPLQEVQLELGLRTGLKALRRRLERLHAAGATHLAE